MQTQHKQNLVYNLWVFPLNDLFPNEKPECPKSPVSDHYLKMTLRAPPVLPGHQASWD